MSKVGLTTQWFEDPITPQDALIRIYWDGSFTETKSMAAGVVVYAAPHSAEPQWRRIFSSCTTFKQLGYSSTHAEILSVNIALDVLSDILQSAR